MLFGKEKVVSNEKEVSVYERLWKLWAMISKMIMDGVRDPQKVADLLQTVVDGACATVTTHLRHLCVVNLSRTDGTRKFINSGIFNGGMGGLDRLRATDVIPASAAKVHLWGMAKDGSLSEIFGSLRETRVLWTEHQVDEFCRHNINKLQRSDNCIVYQNATFFEMEDGIVASVFVDDHNRRRLVLNLLSDPYTWSHVSRHQVAILEGVA